MFNFVALDCGLVLWDGGLLALFWIGFGGLVLFILFVGCFATGVFWILSFVCFVLILVLVDLALFSCCLGCWVVCWCSSLLVYCAGCFVYLCYVYVGGLGVSA